MNLKPIKPLIILAIVVFTAGIVGVCLAFFGSHSPTPEKSDYQITLDSNTIIIKDGPRVVGKIPYSDSSDVWRIVIDDNQ